MGERGRSPIRLYTPAHCLPAQRHPISNQRALCFTLLPPFHAAQRDLFGKYGWPAEKIITEALLEFKAEQSKE